MKHFLLALLATSALTAQFPSSERCWEVGGTYLYWKPCAPTFDYGVTEGVKTLTVKPDYGSGFRVHARTDTHDCCHCWWLNWEHFDTTDRARSDEPAAVIFPSFQPAQVATRAQMQHQYNKVDVRAGRYLSAHCDSRYYAFAGLGYLDITRKQQAFADIPLTNRQRATFEGGLLEVGAGAEVEEPCNFRLLGQMVAMAAIGKRRLTQEVTFPDGALSYRYPRQTICLPGLNMRLAVEWRYHFSCAWAALEIGYELTHFFDVLRLPTVPLAFGTATFNYTTSFNGIGFGGPFVGAAVRF